MDDRNFVTRLLKQSILTLCREAVNYSAQLEVDGIVSVTVDGNAVHIVKIHELFLRQGDENANDVENQSAVNDHYRKSIPKSIKQVTQVPEVHYDVNQVTVKEEKVEETDDNSNELNKNQGSNIEGTPEHTGGGVTENVSNGTLGNSGSPSVHASSINMQLQNLPTSKEIDIPCKKCSDVLADVDAYESHCLKVHSQYTCRVCLSTFTSRNNMKRHIRIHTGVKPYSCKQCMESFARNDDYKRHLLRHTFNKPFRCSICYTGYSDRTSVKSHMAKEHNGMVFHICPQCGETFVDGILFQRHKRIHPEFSDYSCTICSFTGSNGLVYNKHMLTHGPPKQYKCDHCERVFGNPFTYTNHLKLHKDDELVQSYACCFCDLRLSSFEQFLRHEHSHVQARQYGCKICDKQFRYPSSLKEHLMTHIMRERGKALESQRESSDSEMIGESGDTKMVAHVNDSRDQELTELNNNNVETDKDEGGEGKNSDDGHSNDYWCTECNQGFETEELLQDHIMNTHETGMMPSDKNSSENKSKEQIDDHGAERMSTPTDLSTSPFESSTQVDGSYDYMYDQSTQKDIPEFSERNRAFDEETVIDGDSEYQKDIVPELKGNPNAQLTPAEMAITANAVKQVLDIQKKFGIKPHSRKSTWTRPIPPFSSVRHSPLASSSIFSNGLHASNLSGKRLPSSPLGINRSPIKITKKPLSVMPSSLKVKMHQRKLPYPRQLDDNAMDIDVHDPSSTEDSIHSAFFENIKKYMDGDSSGFSPPQYSKSPVLETDRDVSTTPKTSGSTSLNLKVRNPGFEKVVTPDILFRTKAPFTCEVCEETFKDFEGFDRHGTAVHRRFICSFCGKVFTSRPNRERHVRYHTGEKPYKCDLCDMAFFRGDDLKYHRTTRHPDVKPFVCGICTSTFSQAKELEKHLRMYPDHRR